MPDSEPRSFGILRPVDAALLWQSDSDCQGLPLEVRCGEGNGISDRQIGMMVGLTPYSEHAGATPRAHVEGLRLTEALEGQVVT